MIGMYAYLRVQTDCADSRLGDELTFRKAIQDALARSFGLNGAGTYVDVLRFRSGTIKTNTLGTGGSRGTNEHGHTASAAATSTFPGNVEEEREVQDAVIRVSREDASRVKAALAAAPTRLAVVDEANFLPALLASEPSDP